LGPRKQRFALAILALHVNQPITIERLVELTWPDPPPRTARHAVQVCVSRLRGRLADAAGPTIRIVTRGATYGLQADPMCIDVFRFRALLDASRDEHLDEPVRAATLQHALALWHGPPLADVAPPADPLCQRLEEARLAACEELLAAQMRLGRHGTVIDQLVGLAAQYPHRQRLVALLMLALYRDGRAPEALRAYRLARHRLAEDFGLDPHVELQQLEGDILRADPRLDPVPDTTRRPRTRPLIGHAAAR
jgi:ABC-2 type transport system ATP-binding protein